MGCPESLVIGATRLLVEEVGPLILSATDVLMSVSTCFVYHRVTSRHFRYLNRRFVVGVKGWL
jgi:hypothetical protein